MTAFNQTWASSPPAEDIMRLQARLRAHYERKPLLSVVPTRDEVSDGLDLTYQLLRAALDEPSVVRARKLIEAARAAAKPASAESGEFLRRQLRGRVLELLDRYRLYGQTHRNLIDILNELSLWQPADVPRLARLAGIHDDRRGEYAKDALELVEVHPKQLAKMVNALRAVRELSDEQRALLIITQPPNANDAYALIWSMANAYAAAVNPREDLSLFDRADVLHLAVENLMIAYQDLNEAVFKAMNQVTRANAGLVADATTSRRDEFIRLFKRGQLFGAAPKPERPMRREQNVLHVEFGCQSQFEGE